MRVGILTLSDTRTEATDESGKAVRAALEGLAGAEIVETYVVADNKDCIQAELIRYADDLKCRLVLTTGGTGLGPRDVTPEATQAVCDRLVPGIPEAMRAALRPQTPLAMLSRATAGLRGECLIINLPGSPKEAREYLGVILPVLPQALHVAAGGQAN